MKTVLYRDFVKAVADAQLNLDKHVMLVNLNSHDIVQMGVNFFSLGNVRPLDALNYAAEIRKAAKVAADFPLNGYQITYGSAKSNHMEE